MFEKSSLFGGKPVSSGQGQVLFHTAPAQSTSPLPPEVLNEIRDAARRLRTLEERQISLRKTMQVNEQDGLSKYKKFISEMKALTDDIDLSKRDFRSLEEKMTLLVGELQQFAKKDDVIVLKKYINLWEPLQFVTKHEVAKLVDEAVEKAQRPEKNTQLSKAL